MNGGVGTRSRWAVYLLVVLLVCPLAAYSLAVDGLNHGLGWQGFLVVLFGLPVACAVLAARFLRIRRQGAAVGAIGAAFATFAFLLVAFLVP
jgi:hypothetical protein